MPKAHNPRHGSMQFWPRKRAKRAYAKIRYWGDSKDALPMGFAGYKVGMTHVTMIDNRKHSKTKGTEIFCPVTIVECPPLKIYSALFYKHDVNKWVLKNEITFKADKELSRRLKLGKKEHKLEDIKIPIAEIVIIDAKIFSGLINDPVLINYLVQAILQIN